MCKEMIRENDQNWQEGKYRAEMRKLRREEEEKKEERKDSARDQQKKWREKFIQTTIAEKLTKMNSKEKQEWEQFLLLDSKEREYRLEVAEAKENLWRWRGTRKSQKEEKMRKGFMIGGGEKMEKRLEKLKEILQKSKVEREKERKKEEEMRASVHSKLDKEKEEKRRRLEIKRRQEEKWGMIRWLTEFMDLETNSVEQPHHITTTGKSPTNPGSEIDKNVESASQAVGTSAASQAAGKAVNMGDNDIEMVISRMVMKL